MDCPFCNKPMSKEEEEAAGVCTDCYFKEIDKAEQDAKINNK